MDEIGEDMTRVREVGTATYQDGLEDGYHDGWAAGAHYGDNRERLFILFVGAVLGGYMTVVIEYVWVLTH